MTNPKFQIMQCEQEDCGFRFPTIVGRDRLEFCPRCGGRIHIENLAYTSLMVENNSWVPERPVIDVVLDNIRSAWNAGSMLRTADGAGVHCVHLCGLTPTPENPKTAKTALGAEEVVPWVYHLNALQAVKELQSQGLAIWSLEGGPRSTPITAAIQDLGEKSVALVIGNEVSGIDPEIVACSEKVISIPMFGYKRSLNVAVAFGVAIYTLRLSTILGK